MFLITLFDNIGFVNVYNTYSRFPFDNTGK